MPRPYDCHLMSTIHLPGDAIYRLTRDGTPIMEGTEIEVIAYIHKHHPYSLMHAVNHEGYRLEPVSPQP